MKFIDLTNKKFGRLLVLSLDSKGKRTYWNCICDCGNKKRIDGQHLKTGKIVSCGCYSIERISNLNKTHGQSKTRLYKIWSGIKNRCLNKNSCRYKDYGGRGIKICDEWLKYENFYCWAKKNNYDDYLSIDRIDNNGNYEPSNCRWVNNLIQSNNTRKNIIIEFEEKNYSAKELCKFLNLNYRKFLYRFHKTNNVNESIYYSKK